MWKHRLKDFNGNLNPYQWKNIISWRGLKFVQLPYFIQFGKWSIMERIYHLPLCLQENMAKEYGKDTVLEQLTMIEHHYWL
jgi:hypothetical protein